jgi:soluble lytic murein transglycosylase-like protein
VLKLKVFDRFIKKYATKNGLNPALVKAVIWKESNFDPGAYRYEPGFYKRYIKNNEDYKTHPLQPFPRTISASYGLMQIMYTTALSIGFDEHGAPMENFYMLYTPELNIKLGCAYLAKMRKKYYSKKHSSYSTADEKMLSSYNAGRPISGNKKTYVDRILKKAELYSNDFC